MNTAPRTTRLGKGLAALMGDQQATAGAEAGGIVREVGIDQLEPSPFQPRMDMPEEPMQELTESVKERGILQPILVRPHPSVPDRFQIIAGERRWRAAGLAGLHHVPVYVRALPDIDAAAAALVENLQRQDLNPIEEAEGLKRLIDEFGFTHEQMGQAVSKSRPHITNMLRLLQLPSSVQMSVREGKLSFAHARTILRHPDPEAVSAKVIARELSVRQTEKLVTRDLEPRPPRQTTVRDPNLRAAETDFSDALGLRVRMLVNADGKGQIVISVDNWLQIEDLKERLTVS